MYNAMQYNTELYSIQFNTLFQTQTLTHKIIENSRCIVLSRRSVKSPTTLTLIHNPNPPN